MEINRKPLNLKYIVFCVLSITLILMVVYVILYFNAKNTIENQLGTNAQSVAVSVSLDIMENIEEYKAFLETKDINSDYYKRMQNKFEKIKAESNIRFIFTERRMDSETIEFILDSEPIGSTEHSPPGSTGPNDWKREKVYGSGLPAKFKVYNHPRWGKIIAAYAPLFDKNDEMIGIIGVNIDITELFSQLNGLFRIMVITYIIIIAITTALLIKFSNAILKLTGRLENSQKAAEQSAVSFRMFKTLLDALETYLFVAELETDKVIFINAKMKEHFHLGDDVIGCPCYEVLNPCMEERCDFCVKHKLLKNPHKAETMDTQVEINGIHYKKADRIIEWYDGRKVHLQYFIDITELKQAEAALKTQLAQFQRMSALINAAPQYISYINLEGEYEFFNPATCTITGYTYDELMKGGVTMLYSDVTNLRIAEEILPAIAANGRHEYEIPLIRKDGEVRIMSFSSFEVTSDKSKHGCIATDVTEQKRLEAEIVEAKEKLERLINTAPVAYGLSIDGIVLECNEYSKKYLGMKPGDKTEAFYVHPEEREAIFANTGVRGSSINGIVRLYLQSGGSHRFFVNYNTLRHGEREACILWAVDIEDSELQKDRLWKTQQSLQTVLDFLPVPITIIDVEEGYLIYANKCAAELFGALSPESVYGQHVEEFMPKAQPDGTNSFNKTLFLDFEEPTSIELVCRKTSGETFDALVTACVIDYEDRKASISVIQDLTAEKEYQDMLRNTADKEREANRAKSGFLSRMSHEIRTPLNAITGMTMIAKTSRDQEKTLHYLDKIDDASKHLLELVNDVLDMSKIESGKMELSDSPVNVKRLFEDVTNIINFRVKSKMQTFLIDIGNDVPAAIMGDRLRLSQIITNLLSNANKFTPEGGKITLTISKLSDQDGRCTLQFVVEDNGIGISSEQQERLFDAFEQADGSTSRIYGGTGLGLAISKQLVEMMGGEIWIESELDQGSRFIFTIAAKTCTVPLDDGEKAEMSSDANTAFNGQTILLAEDVDINREIISAILEDSGLNIVYAENGLEAVESFKSNPGLYSLVLMDIQMPEMDGYEATGKIRSLHDDMGKHVPIIAMTANVFKEDIEQCLAAGMNDHIGKPIDVEDLFNKLRKHLQ